MHAWGNSYKQQMNVRGTTKAFFVIFFILRGITPCSLPTVILYSLAWKKRYHEIIFYALDDFNKKPYNFFRGSNFEEKKMQKARGNGERDFFRNIFIAKNVLCDWRLIFVSICKLRNVLSLYFPLFSMKSGNIHLKNMSILKI